MIKRICYIKQEDGMPPEYTDAVYYVKEYNGVSSIFSRLTETPIPKSEVDISTDTVEMNKDFILVNTFLYHTPEIEARCKEYVNNIANKNAPSTYITEEVVEPQEQVVEPETVVIEFAEPEENNKKPSKKRSKKKSKNKK